VGPKGVAGDPHGQNKMNLQSACGHPFAAMYLSRNAIVLAMTLVFCAWPARAHAILLGAIPTAHQVVNGGSIPIELHFNSRIDGRRSRLSLIGPDGRERALPIRDQPSPDTLTAEAETLLPGSYMLRWQVLAEDGHITRGEVPFQAQ
jgi:methionine-rich copper-binding protein CopC